MIHIEEKKLLEIESRLTFNYDKLKNILLEVKKLIEELKNVGAWRGFTADNFESQILNIIEKLIKQYEINKKNVQSIIENTLLNYARINNAAIDAVQDIGK